MSINETGEPRNWLKVEKAILIVTVIAFIITVAALISMGLPGELQDNLSNELRVEKLIAMKNQLIEYLFEALTTIAAVLGVIAILFNVYYTAKQAEAMDRQAIAAVKSLDLARENALVKEQEQEKEREKTRLIQEGQITEQFLGAVEKLGYDNIPIRLGGIYALEKIANISPTDHSTIVEVLTAFVRDNAPLNPSAEKEKTQDAQPPNTNTDFRGSEDIEASPKLRVDIQAALSVIGRRNSDKDAKNQRLDLNNTDIGGAMLSLANLQGALLSSANLQRADLLQANLQGAMLSSANLQGAFLMGANLVGAVFRGANLQGAFFVGANLQGVDFRGANLQGAFLMGSNLLGADLREANLLGADLTEAKNVESRQIESALLDRTTSLPDKLVG